MFRFIKGWEELNEVSGESKTHTLDVKDSTGWIYPRDKKDREDYHYLSTHTFYGDNYKESTEILQKCGFNVVLDNWDK